MGAKNGSHARVRDRDRNAPVREGRDLPGKAKMAASIERPLLAGCDLVVKVKLGAPFVC